VPEQLIIVDGATFVFSDPNGDIEADKREGFFFEDVRHLSRWCLTLDGKPLAPLTTRVVDHFSARVVGAKEGDSEPSVSVTRNRFVADGMHEDLIVTNHSAEEERVRLELSFASDFADIMEAQKQGTIKHGRYTSDVGTRALTLWQARDGYRRGTAIRFSRRGRLRRDRVVFDLRLRPRESWQTCVEVTPIAGGRKHRPLLGCDSFGKHAPKMPMSLEEWLETAPELEADWDPLNHVYRQSLVDLAALRIRPEEEHLRWAMAAGGLPWFMTVFGRDSIIAAYEALPFQAEMAQATLQALADLQATDWDDFADSQPGKILHELRRGSLAAIGEIPRAYYGTHDATALFLILLDEYERWTGDRQFVRGLEDNVRAALAWLEGPADLDGDGYLEYVKRSNSPSALDNHCWKDSDDSIRFADGRRAEPPIATCEVQGYAYDARLRTARLMRELWRDNETAERLEEDATELKRRFNRDFWIARRGHYALALDRDKEQVDSMTSNVGHLLWSGIVDERRAARVVKRLLRKDMFSGWGLRSMSTEDAGYNPLEYHNGTVWPHDTAIVAEGMRRYGFRDEAGQLCGALLRAAEAFGSQLPEVFAGFPRDETNAPVEYPNALKPQAWAAGAPLLALRTLLGLDVVNGKLRRSPHIPESLGKIRLEGVEQPSRQRGAARGRRARRR
jgi:glycogen debranching enzyme